MKKYKPATKEELKKLVFTDGIKLNCVDTSLITDMSNLFHESKRKDFEGIEYWDVSNVEDMSYMFAYMDYNFILDLSRIDFNPNLNNWNVSKVKDMRYMFKLAESFNQPLDKWDTSNVEDMSCMFNLAKNFNQPLNSWNVSNVTNIACMFQLAKSFNQPLDKWDTKKVISIAFLFEYADKFDHYESLEHWNLDKLKDITLICDDENKLHTRLKVYMQVFYPKEDYITITKDNVKEIYNLISKDKNRRISKLRKKLESDFSKELSSVTKDYD